MSDKKNWKRKSTWNIDKPGSSKRVRPSNRRDDYQNSGGSDHRFNQTRHNNQRSQHYHATPEYNNRWDDYQNSGYSDQRPNHARNYNQGPQHYHPPPPGYDNRRGNYQNSRYSNHRPNQARNYHQEPHHYHATPGYGDQGPQPYHVTPGYDNRCDDYQNLGYSDHRNYNQRPQHFSGTSGDDNSRKRRCDTFRNLPSSSIPQIESIDNKGKCKKLKEPDESVDSLTYETREGTTDFGKLYEDYFSSYNILQLLQKTEDFRISTDAGKFGAFDDCVIEGTEKYAIQLKHRNKDLTTEHLRSGKDFNIVKKYYKSFQECIHQLSEYKLILYTNAKFTPTNTPINFVEDGGVTVRITECDPFSLINTPMFGKSFQFQLDPENSEEIKQKYKEFFERFFLYTNQTNVQELEATHIPHSLRALTSQSSVQNKLLKFMSAWSLIGGIKTKLTKSMMVKLITLYIVEELIQPHIFCEVNNEKKLIQDAISDFNIAAFESKSLTNVVKIWGDAKTKLRDSNIKQLNEIITHFQIRTKHIENIDEMSAEECTKLLWLMDECPLIIKGDPAAYEAARLCGEKSKFVFITDDLEVKKLEELTIFKTLSDLKRHEATYNNILKNLSFTLFGEETYVEEIIKDDDLITTDEIAKMADNFDFIKLEEEELCFPYVDRHLYRNIIELKKLQKVDENTMVLISTVADEKKLKDALQNFEVVSITKELHRNGIINSINDKENGRSKKYKLFFNRTETSPEEFISLCTKSEKYKKFYHFKYHDVYLELIESMGDVSDLQNFVIKSDEFLEDEKLFMEKIRNKLTIVVADPGMGKSIFVKNLKNNFLSKYLTVVIRPLDVPELCRFVKVPENLQQFFTFIVQSKFPNCGNFQKQVLELLMEKGKAIFLWDALDELSEQNRIFVERLIFTLVEKTLAQFITSRGSLRKQLEDNFEVLSQELQPFNDIQQTDYIHRRLQDICSGEELEAITTTIKENITNMLGIPLQIYMLTELFRQDLEKYKKLFTELFVITDLYSHFVEEKFEVYFKKGGSGSYKDNIFLNRSVSDRKKKYQDVALKLLFGSTFLSKPRKVDVFLKEIKKEGDEFGFITAVDNKMQPGFLHNSYAEYFAAIYFAENCPIGLENVLFDRKFENVRYFFDTLLAKDSPVHIAVLCENLNYLKNCDDDEFRQKDLQGRNALHLAASWGERYPLLEVSFGSTIFIDDNSIFETKEEHADYHQIIETLLVKCDPHETDDLFNLTPTVYAEKCECLFAAVLIGKHNYLRTKNKTFMYSLLYYGIKYGFHDIVDFFENIEFARTDSGSTLLHMAVENNQLRYLNKLLENEVFKQNINYKNGFGETALMKAAEGGYVEAVQCLKEANANVNAASNDLCTPLHVAAMNGRINTVKYLIENNANVKAVDNDGWTPLHAAAEYGHIETVEYLIKEGATVNAVTTDDWTALHAAAMNGRLETVKCLIEKGANVKAVNKDGRTVLHAAAKSGHLETVEYLTQHADVRAANNDGCTPLHIAALDGHLEIVKYLIQEHADVNEADNDGWTALHAAAKNGHLETVRYLIQQANVSVVNNDGCTPLHMAALNGRLETVKYLIQEGADFNAFNNDGWTPLHVAAQNGHLATVKYLIQVNANVYAVNNLKWTPLHTAAGNGHIETVKYLIHEKVDVNAVNSDAWTALHVAAGNGHLETVKYLIQERAEVDAVNSDGWTPLHLAALNGHLEIVKYLIQEHANVNALNNDGRTALHAAAKNGHLETVKYLIQKHANVSAVNDYGWTPLHIAAANEHLDTVAYLIQALVKIELVLLLSNVDEHLLYP